MSFSIVTVALNAADDLPLTIESVIQQRYEDVEYILIDGGSWDHTHGITKMYANAFDRIVRLEDAGIYFAMNEALAHCTNEYVLFMNARDRFFSGNVLEKVWSAREGDPDVIFGDHIYVNGRTEILTRARRFEDTREDLLRGRVSHKWHNSIPCHQATFTRRSLLSELKYDTRLEICADHDFLFRAFDHGAQFQYVDEVVCHYMGGGYSARREQRCRQEITYVYRRFSSHPASVDKLLMGDRVSPFSKETSRTGVALGGMYHLEGPYPDRGLDEIFRWCSMTGFEVMSPSRASSNLCVLEGYNPFPDQILTATLDGLAIGSVDLPTGLFKVDVPLLQIVPAGSMVAFATSQYGSLGGDKRVVSIALTSVRFVEIDSSVVAPLRLGVKRIFALGAGDDTASTSLIAGWSGMEVDHTWSIGPVSLLALRSSEHPRHLKLVLSANPHVEPEFRFVDISVNGRAGGRWPLDVGPTQVVIDLEDAAWSCRESNLITLRPGRAAVPPENDDRLLGVCIKAAELD